MTLLRFTVQQQLFHHQGLSQEVRVNQDHRNLQLVRYTNNNINNLAMILIFTVGRPFRLTNLNVVTDSTSISVSWSFDKRDIIFGYELQYRYTIRECWRSSELMNITFASPANSYILENLEEDSDFTISLFAINPAGRSEPACLNTTTLQSGKILLLGSNY